MDDRLKALFGSWVQATGTTVSAVGNTPSVSSDKELLSNLALWGNVLQATGNALIADSIEKPSLSKIGNQVQSIGNLTIIVKFLIVVNEEIQNELNIKGNLLQAVGGGASLADALNEEITMESFYDIYGNLLQVIGNSMQAISGINKSKGADDELINTIGSWIQAIGANISALGTLENPMS